jgi:hypothetical protein
VHRASPFHKNSKSHNKCEDTYELISKQLVDGHDVELWDCGRLVARLSPDGETLSPELAPFSISTAPKGESISLSQVSKLAESPKKGNPLLLGW